MYVVSNKCKKLWLKPLFNCANDTLCHRNSCRAYGIGASYFDLQNVQMAKMAHRLFTVPGEDNPDIPCCLSLLCLSLQG